MIETTSFQPCQISDAELIKCIINGEKKSFELIIRRYNQRLFRIGMSILNNEIEVEDAMQTTYVKAYLNLPKFEQRSALGTWLIRILMNECVAAKKAKNRPFNLELNRNADNKPNMETPVNILVNKELGTVLEHAVAKLPEKYRLVFVLRELEDMSVKETGEVLGLEEPNVKVRLNRAKMILRKNLDGYLKENVFNFHLTHCDNMVAKVFSSLNLVK